MNILINTSNSANINRGNNSSKHSKIIFSLMWLWSAAISGIAQHKPDYPADLQQLQQNVIKNFLRDTVSVQSVEKLLTTLRTNGSFTTIDYTNLERGGWPVIEHLRNLQTLTRAYEQSGNLHHKKELLLKVLPALNYWLDNDFQNPNWWNPQIGVPKLLAPILITLESELTPVQLRLGIKILNRSAIGMGGQNKVWLSGNVLLKNLLLRNADSVQIAAASIREELKVSTDLGIQPDWSFHEHGAMLQFGNYGLHYLEDMIMWLDILNNTPFAFEVSKMNVLRNYVLNGMQWIVFKKTMDISASGRQLFKEEQVRKRTEFIHHLDQLQEIDPAFGNKYSAAKNYKNLIGDKHFWRSDFHVHRTPNYYFSIRLSSTRVRAYETANLENLRGYHTGSGMTLLYQTDEEYKDIYPFWDWKKLPGITMIQDTAALIVATAWGYTIDDDFVGGVSDGTNGVAALQYNRSGLKANKAWFMINDKIVCLGNGITAKTNDEVTTSINQTLLQGSVIVNNHGENKVVFGDSSVTNPRWVLHNNIGYIFPTGGNVNLATKSVTGSWHNVAHRYVDEPVSTNIFSLWLSHGSNPVNQQYAYSIIPNANATLMATLTKQKESTIINNDTLQAVVSTNGHIAGAVFYKAGKANIFGGVQVDQPCIVLLTKQSDKVLLSISDPTQKLTDIRFSIKGKYKSGSFSNGITTCNIKLPKGFEAGKSMQIILKQ